MSTLIIVSIVASANRLLVRDVLWFLVREFFQVFIPLNREQVLFLVIALLASRHEIALAAFSAPYQGNDMVHGQLCRIDMPAAIVADTFRHLSLPPGRLPQFPGPLLLFIDSLFIYFDIK
jgi:hypothetical protein